MTQSTSNNGQQPQVRLLVVDDTQAIREHIAELLRSRCNVTVVQAENGVQALKRMREHVFSLMVTDVNMPLLDGLKLTTLVRQDHVHGQMPILVMTTEANQEDRSRALAMGASDYLKKPAPDDDIVRRVLRLLGQGGGGGGGHNPNGSPGPHRAVGPQGHGHKHN